MKIYNKKVILKILYKALNAAWLGFNLFDHFDKLALQLYNFFFTFFIWPYTF